VSKPVVGSSSRTSSTSDASNDTFHAGASLEPDFSKTARRWSTGRFRKMSYVAIDESMPHSAHFSLVQSACGNYEAPELAKNR
jgi:hydroxyacyl-ACP dehydratase HTD2-like protein with hotdog domain